MILHDTEDALQAVQELLRETVHELRFLVESHPRSCGCRTCVLLLRADKEMW